MITKHFFKVLIVFFGMIILGIVGVVLANFMSQKEAENTPNTNQVAK